MHDDEPDDVAVLVSAAVGGDQTAWNRLVNRYAPLVLAVARQCRVEGPDRQDVVQTVWLRLIEHLCELREPRALPRWLVVTTRRECYRFTAGTRRTTTVDPVDLAQVAAAQGDADPDWNLLRDERRNALLAAFAELSDRQRELLFLLMAEPPLSYSEISERLGVSVGSIGPTRGRALERLRRSPAISGE